MSARDPLAPLKKRTHASLVREVLVACNRLPGVSLYAVDVGGAKRKHGTPGVSDIVGWKDKGCPCDDRSCNCFVCCDGQAKRPIFVALEIKCGRDKLRPAQAEFLEHVRQAGGIGLEIRDVMQAVEALR